MLFTSFAQQLASLFCDAQQPNQSVLEEVHLWCCLLWEPILPGCGNFSVGLVQMQCRAILKLKNWLCNVYRQQSVNNWQKLGRGHSSQTGIHIARHLEAFAGFLESCSFVLLALMTQFWQPALIWSAVRMLGSHRFKQSWVEDCHCSHSLLERFLGGNIWVGQWKGKCLTPVSCGSPFCPNAHSEMWVCFILIPHFS